MQNTVWNTTLKIIKMDILWIKRQNMKRLQDMKQTVVMICI